MAMVNLDKILDRIQKLLALAGNNSSEAEAAAAAERAAQLLAEYNITMMEVGRFGSDDQRIKEDGIKASRKNQTWARSLWSSVANLNFCMFTYRARTLTERFERTDGHLTVVGPRPTDEYILIGTKANVATTKAMATYLVDTVERLARDCKEARSAHGKHAFRVGCALRLTQRLRALRDERVRPEPRPDAHSGTTLPSLADVYNSHDGDNRKLYVQLHGRMPTAGRRRRG